MKFCDKHWAALRAAIDTRGLTHLVARDGKEAVESLVSELNGEPSTFIDPLMCAHNMIACRAIECGGLGMLGQDEHGNELCPVCEAMRGYARTMAPEQTEREWIEGPAGAALKECRDRGLIPTPGVDT